MMFQKKNKKGALRYVSFILLGVAFLLFASLVSISFGFSNFQIVSLFLGVMLIYLLIVGINIASKEKEEKNEFQDLEFKPVIISDRPEEQEAVEEFFLGNIISKTYHKPGCRFANAIKIGSMIKENKKYFKSQKYKSCGSCKP